MEWDKDYILIQVDRQTLLKLDLSVADPVRTTWPNPFTNDKKCLGFSGFDETFGWGKFMGNNLKSLKGSWWNIMYEDFQAAFAQDKGCISYR